MCEDRNLEQTIKRAEWELQEAEKDVQRAIDKLEHQTGREKGFLCDATWSSCNRLVQLAQQVQVYRQTVNNLRSKLAMLKQMGTQPGREGR